MTRRLELIGILALTALVIVPAPAAAAPGKPVLAQHPSLSRTHIVFACAGDLWLIGRDGGPAARRTTHPDVGADYVVEMEPAAVKAGRDPQLEKAVEVAMELLRKDPPPKHTKPAYPDYQKKK